MSKKIAHPPREQVYQDYVVDKTPAKILASRYGYTNKCNVYRMFRRLGIPLRGPEKYATAEELREDYATRQMDAQAIADKYGYSDSSHVYHLLAKMGVPLRGYPSYRLFDTHLSDEQQQFVVGTLLGDGCIPKLPPKRRHHHIRFMHTEAQREYIEWKRQFLAPFSPNHIRETRRKDWWSPNTILAFATIQHPDFDNLRTLFYPDDRKRVSEAVLSRITPLSLAVWVMDDGWYNKSAKIIEISTQSFSLEEHRLIQAFFAERYGIDARLQGEKKDRLEGVKYWRIRFTRPATAQLVNLIEPYVLPTMRYKLGYQ